MKLIGTRGLELKARALNTFVEDMLTGAEYKVEEAVGIDPSVVKRMVIPVPTAVIVTV